VQASLHWTTPTGTLGRLIATARERVAALRERRAELRIAATAQVRRTPSMVAALRAGRPAIIAEIKRSSHSKGAINPGIDAAAQARAYAAGGARALSVLTEPSEFGGAPSDLLDAAAACDLPILKKDFHVDPVQMLEARALGASAALLIARALSPDALREMAAAAAEQGIEVLVEVRDEAELARALELDAAMIGVNNRNLETLEIDPLTSARIIPLIPPSRVRIAESGIATPGDVTAALHWGADAVLVGSSISRAADPVAAVRALASARLPSDVPQIKFCGLTRAEDARHAALLGAAYVGVIFAESPRHVTLDQAREVLGGAPSAPNGAHTRPVRRVGVFGATTAREIAETAAAAGLDVVQLHGDPSPDLILDVKRAAGVAVWPVVRVKGSELPGGWERVVSHADALVLDARPADARPGAPLGGTGVTFDWDGVAKQIARVRRDLPIVLAGGLTPENVRAAVRALDPAVVDVSSGVEQGPGIKDHDRMRAFAAAVREGPGNGTGDRR
jgi:indole-3-glycerol phosphate synthase/phosphoribosylanthranilate isomerase